MRSALGSRVRSGLRQQALSTDWYLQRRKERQPQISHICPHNAPHLSSRFPPLTCLPDTPVQTGCFLSVLHSGSRPAEPHRQAFLWQPHCPAAESSVNTPDKLFIHLQQQLCRRWNWLAVRVLVNDSVSDVFPLRRGTCLPSPLYYVQRLLGSTKGFLVSN